MESSFGKNVMFASNELKITSRKQGKYDGNFRRICQVIRRICRTSVVYEGNLSYINPSYMERSYLFLIRRISYNIRRICLFRRIYENTTENSVVFEILIFR